MFTNETGSNSTEINKLPVYFGKQHFGYFVYNLSNWKVHNAIGLGQDIGYIYLVLYYYSAKTFLG